MCKYFITFFFFFTSFLVFRIFFVCLSFFSFFFVSFVLECRKSDVEPPCSKIGPPSRKLSKKTRLFRRVCTYGVLISRFFFFFFHFFFYLLIFTSSKKSIIFIVKFEKLIATHEVVQARQTKNIPKCETSTSFFFLFLFSVIGHAPPFFFFILIVFFFCFVLFCNVLYILASPRLIVS